jgi:tetratricopeptide (TPR) repeat protein
VAENAPDGSGRLGLADYYLAMNRSDQALPVLEGVSAEAEFYARAKTRVAAVEYSQNRKEKAHGTIDEVLKREPKNADALLMKSRFLLAENRTEEALPLVESAVQADPRSIQGHYALGGIHAAQRQYEEAIKAFQEVLKLNPRAVPAQLQLSRLELLRGGTEESRRLAQEAVSAQPENPIARLTLARSLLASGETARAESEMADLLQKYPNAAPVQSQMGLVQLARNDRSAARRSFERATALDPNYLEGLAGLVTVDVTEGRHADARARVEAQLAKQPDNPALLMLAARVYASTKDLPKAEQSLRRAIEVNPAALPAYGLLGQIYLAQRKLDEAAAEFESLSKRQPGNVGASTMVAMIRQAQDRHDEAMQRYEQIVLANPRAAVASNNLAWMYAERDVRIDEALQLAQNAKRELPEQPEVLDTLGFIYLKKKLPALAVPELRLAVEKDPKNPEYRYRLGLAYSETGNIPAARQEFEQALKLRPDFEGADDARRLLASM